MAAATGKCTRSIIYSTKFEELEIMAEEEKLDIIAITESWSNSQIGDSKLALKGYAVFRKFRERDVEQRGGEVLLYIKKKLIATELVEWRRKECEAVWVGVRDDKGVEICIGVCYSSPNAGDVENRVLMDVISRVAKGRLLQLIGDFNYPMIDWEMFDTIVEVRNFLMSYKIISFINMWIGRLEERIFLIWC